MSEETIKDIDQRVSDLRKRIVGYGERSIPTTPFNLTVIQLELAGLNIEIQSVLVGRLEQIATTLHEIHKAMSTAPANRRAP